MTTNGYYRRALFLPFAVLCVSLVVWRVGEAISPERTSVAALASLGHVSVLIHLVAVVPYAILLLLASTWIARDHALWEARLAVWVTPLILALAVASVLLISEPIDRASGYAIIYKPLAWGLGAALVGYAYALVIEAGFHVCRWTGLIHS
jgi:hypothetical protein